MINNIPKDFFTILQWLCVGILIILFVYCFRQFGVNCHFEEWTGRGLYPSLALANGFDLYETQKGSLVTLYGVGMALFYLPASLFSHPSSVIWFAYLLNVSGILLPIFILSKKLFNYESITLSKKFISHFFYVLLIVFILILEKTTFGILQIHADTAALSFILMALCFFQAYEAKNSKYFLFFTSIFLVFSVWTKLPTLPVLIFPTIYLLLEKRFKEAITFLVVICISFFVTSAIICILYGFGDVYYYIIKFPSGSMWSYRNNLFDGTNAVLKRHSYIEGISLLFRFFVMFVEGYWYFIFSSIVLFLLSFRISHKFKFLFRSVSLISILTLPTCLAHLSRFGAVENALIFTNAFAIIGFVTLLFYFIQKYLHEKHSVLFIISVTFLSLLPSLKLARSLPSSTKGSPHQQAFEYLQTGKKDVYFGWYPISHIKYSGDNYTSIEVPTWVGMNHPNAIKFSLDSIPDGSKYLATCHVGYGSIILQNYLGKLEEVPAPSELSKWRLFEMKALTSNKIQ